MENRCFVPEHKNDFLFLSQARKTMDEILHVAIQSDISQSLRLFIN